MSKRTLHALYFINITNAAWVLHTDAYSSSGLTYVLKALIIELHGNWAFESYRKPGEAGFWNVMKVREA